MKVKPLIIGAVIGAALAWFMGSAKGGSSKNIAGGGITGKFAAPFQANIDSGKGLRGG
jgi:hypothetical protein